MSIFPAYSEEQKSVSIAEDCKKPSKETEWLTNSSFQNIASSSLAENEVWSDSSDEDSDETSNRDLSTPRVDDQTVNKSAITLQQKKKRDIKVKKKSGTLNKTSETDFCFEDKKRNRIYASINTLDHTDRPKYKLSVKRLDSNSKRYGRKKYFQRYFSASIDISKKSAKKNNAKGDSNVNDKLEVIEEIDDERKSNQLTVTAEYNKKLAEHPQDINTWIEYADFQDEVAQTTSFRAESETLKQLTNQKKLSIIEKGLTENPDSIELLKAKLYIMSQILPTDQYSSQIETMLQKDPRNVVLWQAIIMAVQTSCALCKVSAILNLYVKCFSALKQKSKADPKFYDKQVLGLLYQCLTFLRHTGLWEQMWEIVRVNLCLNLALPHETLTDIKTIDAKTVYDMEELILTSKLPLDQLWLRVESLRENCYWTSVDLKKIDVNLIGDERRLVSSEDISDFIYPTISRQSNFRLVVLSIVSLKVPLLPTRHCTLTDFNLDEFFWSVDSLEFILPMIYPMVWSADSDSRLCNESVIMDLLDGKLISGPHLLKFHPARDSFLDFLRSVFKTVAIKLSEIQRTSILIWWMRFERLLLCVSKNDPLQDSSKNKKLKSIIKSFLKEPQNRNNLYFYREFIMIERELGSTDSCIDMLKKILQSQDVGSLSTEEISALFNLYRTCFEILLDPKTFTISSLEVLWEVTAYLKNLASVCFNSGSDMTVEETLYNGILIFLKNPVVDEPEDNFLLPMLHLYNAYQEWWNGLRE